MVRSYKKNPKLKYPNINLLLIIFFTTITILSQRKELIYIFVSFIDFLNINVFF